MHNCDDHVLLDCTHAWSKEVGFYIRNWPHMLAICTWCAKTRIRAVDPRWLRNTMNGMSQSNDGFIGRVA